MAPPPAEPAPTPLPGPAANASVEPRSAAPTPQSAQPPDPVAAPEPGDFEDPTAWFQDEGADGFGGFGAESSEALEALVDNLDVFAGPDGTEEAPGVGVEPATSATAAEPAGNETDVDEVPEVREMFDGIAGVYVRPVRQFLGRLKLGPASKEWLGMCLPAVSMVGRSARSMGLGATAARLEAFEALMASADRIDGMTIDGDLREEMLSAYAELERELPAAFAASDEADLRETLILHSLLRQVPDVGKVSLDKVFGAGLTTIEMMEKATVEDLAVTTGLPTRLAEQICRSVQDYVKARRARFDNDSPAQWLALIGPLAKELEEHHTAFRQTSGTEADRPDDAARRKAHRRARQLTSYRLDVLLAEMGEAGLVEEMQTHSFDGRIRRVGDLVATLSSTSQPNSPTSAVGAHHPGE